MYNILFRANKGTWYLGLDDWSGWATADGWWPKRPLMVGHITAPVEVDRCPYHNIIMSIFASVYVHTSSLVLQVRLLDAVKLDGDALGSDTLWHPIRLGST